MELNKNLDGESLVISVSGRVDTTTAPEFEKFILDNTAGVKELTLDLKDMSYTSSAGLRVLLKAQKLMSAQGEMKVINVQDDVMEVLEITGFTDILTIK